MSKTWIASAKQASRPRQPAIPVWLRMVRFVNRGQDAFRNHLRAYDLNPAQFDVIAQVGRNEGLTQRELADRMVVTPGNITQLLDRMEAIGLVHRDAAGRCNRVHLTERGRQLFNTVVPEQDLLIADRFSSLEMNELETLSSIMRKLFRDTPR